MDLNIKMFVRPQTATIIKIDNTHTGADENTAAALAEVMEDGVAMILLHLGVDIHTGVTWV
jgi:hypothetical protein